MVMPVKVFEISDEVDLSLMVRKLNNFREEENYRTDAGPVVNLLTKITDLELHPDSLAGIFNKDYILAWSYHGDLVESPTTETAPFWIQKFQDKSFLMVQAPSGFSGRRKLLTSQIANTLSEVFYITRGAIVEVQIAHDTLRALHEANPQATKLIWFDDVDIPGVKKLCLAGDGLSDTQLYHDYLQHGKIWYVVFEVQKRNIVVGITRNCVITLFSRGTVTDFVKYIQEDLLHLIE